MATGGEAAPRIIGTGYSVPSRIRRNDDPIFDGLRKQGGEKLFTGYEVRHVLSEGEGLIDIMRPAAEMAIGAAGIAPDDIDILIGDGSMGQYLTPNVVSQLHHVLGLRKRVWVLPLVNSFSQFNAAIMSADALIRAGRARYVLIALGDDWTRYVDYSTPQSISAGDGAAACVMGPMRTRNDWEYVDSHTITDTSYYGSMFMQADRASDVPEGAEPEYTHPFFHITGKGIEGFKKFGLEKAPKAVRKLLDKHRVQASDVSLISHQASAVLMDRWRDVIGPGFYVNTLARYANLVEASVPFNLAWATRNETAFTQDWLVTLCLGPDMHANATLFRRNA